MTGWRAASPFLFASSILLGVTLAGQAPIVPPLAVKLDGLTGTPNPGGGIVIGPGTINARLIAPGGEPATVQAKVFGIFGHPRTPVRDFLFARMPLGNGEYILLSELSPRNGRPMTNAVRIGNIRGNLLAGRVGETVLFTLPAIQVIPAQRYTALFPRLVRVCRKRWSTALA
jgi:hypothetical protein